MLGVAEVGLWYDKYQDKRVEAYMSRELGMPERSLIQDP